MKLSFSTGANREVHAEVKRLVLAGFAGRSSIEVEAHIAEMARQGVPRPTRIPTFWPVLPHLLTQSNHIWVYGRDTTPEVEYVLFENHGSIWVTVGNDQCDIEVERHLSGEKSKNLCPKVVARDAWSLAEVLHHWDELQLCLTCNEVVLQRDHLAALLQPETLLAAVSAIDSHGNQGRMVFSGTIAALSALPNPPYELSMRLIDERLDRELRHDFRVEALTPFEAA